MIRRPTETRGELGSVETTYPVVGMAWVDVRPPRRMITNYGAGELPTGTMEVELRAHIDVQMRDVLEIIAGPERGTRWRAVTPPHRPGRGESLILVEVLNEPLPEPESEP